MIVASELEDELAPQRAADAVVEVAEVAGREVVLEVARVVVTRDVEDLDADGRVVALEDEPLRHLAIERHEGRIAAGLVARADVVAVLVDERVREAGADVEH